MIEHNISEKKRIERMNICINELYSLLEVEISLFLAYL